LPAAADSSAGETTKTVTSEAIQRADAAFGTAPSQRETLVRARGASQLRFTPA